MSRVAPAGYLGLLEAVDRLAGIGISVEIKMQFYSELDMADDYALAVGATKCLRQALVEGLLRGYYQQNNGRIVDVPTWTWASDAKCLGPQPKMMGEKDELFDGAGVVVDGIRREVFLEEVAFDRWFEKGALIVPPKSIRPKLRQGRPVGADFDDSEWMPLIDALVKDGLKLHPAARKVVEENWERIEKRPYAKKPSIIRRLSDRYNARKQSADPGALEKKSD